MSPLASAPHVSTLDLPHVQNALSMPAQSTDRRIHQTHFTEFDFVLSQWRD